MIAAPDPIAAGIRAPAKLARRLSQTAIVLAATVIALLVVMEHGWFPDSEVATFGSFLAAALAPIFAFTGVVVIRFAGSKVSWLEAAALVLSVLVVLWPVVFFWAYSGCPKGLC